MPMAPRTGNWTTEHRGVLRGDLQVKSMSATGILTGRPIDHAGLRLFRAYGLSRRCLHRNPPFLHGGAMSVVRVYSRLDVNTLKKFQAYLVPIRNPGWVRSSK